MSSHKTSHLKFFVLHTSCAKELFMSFPNKKFLIYVFYLWVYYECLDWIYCIQIWSIKRIEQDRKIAIYIIISYVYQLHTHTLWPNINWKTSLRRFNNFLVCRNAFCSLPIPTSTCDLKKFIAYLFITWSLCMQGLMLHLRKWQWIFQQIQYVSNQVTSKCNHQIITSLL